MTDKNKIKYHKYDARSNVLKFFNETNVINYATHINRFHDQLIFPIHIHEESFKYENDIMFLIVYNVIDYILTNNIGKYIEIKYLSKYYNFIYPHQNNTVILNEIHFQLIDKLILTKML